MDLHELYEREGGAPAAKLQQALAHSAESEPNANALALRTALSGIVWTASMRRMYTLVDRYTAPLSDRCMLYGALFF